MRNEYVISSVLWTEEVPKKYRRNTEEMPNQTFGLKKNAYPGYLEGYVLQSIFNFDRSI
jgi:hypothetical protein